MAQYVRSAARGALRRTDRHPILAGIGANIAAEVARAAMLPIISVAAARYLGANEYGVLAIGQVLVGFAASLTGFGLLYAILQLGARREEALSTLLTTGIVASLTTALATYAGLAAWVYLFSYDSETQRVTLLLGLSLLGTALTGQLAAGLQVEGRFALIALAGVVSGACSLAYALAVIFTDRGVLALAWSPVVGTATNAIVLGLALRGQLRPRVSATLARRLFTIGLPFGLNDFLFFIYFSIDAVILSLLADERQVGLYNIPVRILVVVYLVPAVVFSRVLYPRFFAWWVDDQPRLRHVYLLSARTILLLGLLASAGLIMLAGTAIPFVFGESFSDSVALLRVLALAVPIRYLASSSSTVLATSGRNRERVLLAGSAAVLNIALCFVLIPFYDAMGASIGTVLTEAYALVSCVWVVQRRVMPANLLREAKLGLLAIPAAFLVAGVLLSFYEPLAVLSGALALVSLLVLIGPLGYFNPREVFGSLAPSPTRASSE
jgi:O-antigen/teichoic acid export membrane protein